MTFSEKFKNEIRLTEDEVRQLIWGDSDDFPEDLTHVDTETEEPDRWSQTRVQVYRTNDNNPQYYEIYWYEGLTEMQMNEYPSQVARRVIPHKKIITTWMPYNPLED